MADLGGTLAKPKPKPRPVKDTSELLYRSASTLPLVVFPPEAKADDQFGYSVAVAQMGRVVVGSPNAADGHGAAFLTVTESPELTDASSADANPTDGKEGDVPDEMSSELQTSERHVVEFGAAVAVNYDGRRALVSAKHGLPHRSHAPLVSVQDWSIELGKFQEFQLLDIVKDRHYSNSISDSPISLALLNNVIVVGCPWLDGHSTSGSVFLYSRTNTSRFSLHNIIALSDFSSNSSEIVEGKDGFGASVAISGHVVAVGAPEYDSRNGRVALFDHAAETMLTVLAPPPLENSNTDIFFGFSVAIESGNIYVGAPGYADNIGAVFKYFGNFVLQHTLLPSDGHVNDMFGFSLASSMQGRLAVGAPGHSMLGDSSGAVYLFESATGNEIRKFVQGLQAESAMDDGEDIVSSAVGSEFGFSIGLSIDTLVVGADFSAGGLHDELTGAVYMKPFKITQTDSYYTIGFLAMVGAALLIPFIGVSVITYRFMKSKQVDDSNEADAVEMGNGAMSDAKLSVDTSTHSVDLSGHSANGEGVGRSGVSFSSLMSNPSVLSSSIKARFSSLQQNSPMRTPDPVKNPMVRPSVAV